MGTVNIYLLDKNNKRKYGLRLEECFPKSIAATELSYAPNNEIIKLTIDMNFRYWRTLDINQTTETEGLDFHRYHDHGPHNNLIGKNTPASLRKLTIDELGIT